MGTGNAVKTDLYGLHRFIQHSPITYTKDLFVENLRELFSKDSYYHYQRDVWGFPKVVDHTNLPPGAGLNNDLTTRLFIGEKYRKSPTGIFYPALLISDGGTRYVPISMNRDKFSLQYISTKVIDGYGRERIFQTPSHYVQSGAWEGTINIDVITRDSPRARGELCDIISTHLMDAEWHDQFIQSGVLIKGLSVGGPSETDDRNGKLFRQSISCEVRYEQIRHIPVSSVVEIINLCVHFEPTFDSNYTGPAASVQFNIENTLDLVRVLQESI